MANVADMGSHPFDAYLGAQPEPQRSTLEAIAATLRTILPTAEECISYGMPAFKVDGTAVAGFAGFKEHCSYFPHSGEVVERLGDALSAYDCNAGTVRFPVDRPLKPAVLKKLVIERIRLENERVTSKGKVRKLYDNGVVESRGTMRDGAMHGEWTWYRKDGSVKRTGRFDRGTQVGVWRTFDAGGDLVKETRM